jgi:(p)ppGpp synthase/HD superfamily hydrolase
MPSNHDFRKLTDFLVSHGTDKVPHSQTPFLAHLIGVYKDLKEWGCDEDLVVAGLFHSIYGTEAFQGFYLPLTERDTIRGLIGEKAERLAYVNCCLTRDSMDQSAAAGVPQLQNRFTNEPLPITAEEWQDLMTLHLCDRLEQVERTGNWDMRRQGWHDMAQRLGGIALREYERVFAGH